MVVEEVDVRRGVEQAPGIVLAVNRRHEGCQLLEQREGNERPVDRGLALPRGVHLPTDHDLVPFQGKAVFLQEFFERRTVGESLDHRPLFARSE